MFWLEFFSKRFGPGPSSVKYPLNGHARNVRGKTQTRIRQAFVHYFSFFVVVVVVEPAILAWEKIAES